MRILCICHVGHGIDRGVWSPELAVTHFGTQSFFSKRSTILQLAGNERWRCRSGGLVKTKKKDYNTSRPTEGKYYLSAAL